MTNLTRHLKIAVTSTIIAFLLTSGVANAQTIRNVDQYNKMSNFGLKGYDPVSYFPEGGSTPLQGLEQYKLDYMGVTYLFSSAVNLDLFVNDPDLYEPTYGGWCAYAMASGSKVDIQTSLYTIHGRRIHFFVAKRAKANFDKDVTGHEIRADNFWKQISGEEPRL